MCAGCAGSKTVIHPIQPDDIYINETGHVCMSEKYFAEILEAKIDEE